MSNLNNHNQKAFQLQQEFNFKNLITLSYNFKKQVFNDCRVYSYSNLIKILNNNTTNSLDIITIINSLNSENINSNFTYFYSEIKDYLTNRVSYFITHNIEIKNLINNMNLSENVLDLIVLDLCITLFENTYFILEFFINDANNYYNCYKLEDLEKLKNLLNDDLHKYAISINKYDILNKIANIELEKTSFKKRYFICEIDLCIFDKIYTIIDDLIKALEQNANINNLEEVFYESLIDVKTLQGYRGQPGQPFIINTETMLEINADFTKKFNLLSNKNLDNSDNRLLHINDKGNDLIDCNLILDFLKNNNINIKNNINNENLCKIIISVISLRFIQNLLSTVKISKISKIKVDEKLDENTIKIISEEFKYLIIFEILII